MLYTNIIFNSCRKPSKCTNCYERTATRTGVMQGWKMSKYLDNLRKKNCALLGYCAASSCKFLRTFRDPYVVPKRRLQITTPRRVTSQKTADLIYFVTEAWNYASLQCKPKFVWHNFPCLLPVRTEQATVIWVVLLMCPFRDTRGLYWSISRDINILDNFY
jgi:hypothetical protein